MVVRRLLVATSLADDDALGRRLEHAGPNEVAADGEARIAVKGFDAGLQDRHRDGRSQQQCRAETEPAGELDLAGERLHAGQAKRTPVVDICGEVQPSLQLEQPQREQAAEIDATDQRQKQQRDDMLTWSLPWPCVLLP